MRCFANELLTQDTNLNLSQAPRVSDGPVVGSETVTNDGCPYLPGFGRYGAPIIRYGAGREKLRLENRGWNFTQRALLTMQARELIFAREIVSIDPYCLESQMTRRQPNPTHLKR